MNESIESATNCAFRTFTCTVCGAEMQMVPLSLVRPDGSEERLCDSHNN